MRRHNKYRYIEDEDMRRHNYNYNVGIIHCPLPVHTCIGTCRKVRGSGWETLLGLVIVLHNTCTCIHAHVLYVLMICAYCVGKGSGLFLL